MTSKVYTKTYSDIGGVDFSSGASSSSSASLAYIENMYRDYGCGTGAGLETVVGYRELTRLSGRVYAIHPDPLDKEAFLIHAGRDLYRFDTRKRDEEGALTTVAEETLWPTKSTGAILDGKLYLLDGKDIFVYDGKSLSRLLYDPYRPTVYSDEEPLEEPSLLTNYAYEEYHLFSPRSYPYATKGGLSFTVLDNGVCRVSGYVGGEEVLTLPSEVTLGLRRYAVTGIEPFALRDNATVRELHLSPGITEIGVGAFLNMPNLKTVVLPEGVTHIPIQCFDDCPRLKTVYLPKSLAEIGLLAFGASTVTELHYLGSQGEFFNLPGHLEVMPRTLPEGFVFHEFSSFRGLRLAFPLHLPTEELLGVTLDGVALPENEGEVHYRPIYVQTERGWVLDEVYLEAKDEEMLYGKTLTLLIRLYDTFIEDLAAEGKTFPAYGFFALQGCTLLARHDGRLFFSGNPLLPGYIFYSGRTASGESAPSYIGRFSRFTDGDGRAEVRSLLSCGEELFVFTEDIPDSPSVFIHRGEDTGDNRFPRIYPLHESIGGLGALGFATSFLGDVLFLSRRGLVAVSKAALDGERGLSARSGPVDARLLSERLEDAGVFCFGSYLGISVGGRVYLADGRRRTAEGGYDWYFLSGIGSFSGDKERYRFVSGELPEELRYVVISSGGTFLTLTTTDEGYADGELIRSGSAGGRPFSFVRRGNLALPVIHDGERYGGVLSPATVFFECAGLLFFGTEEGRLLVFNTDKREADGCIPRRYYTFAGHAYPSGCATRLDDCGMPNYLKSTVRSGGAVRLKAMSGSKVEVRARTEDGAFTVEDTLFAGRSDFGETDFSSAEFYTGEVTVLPLREAKRRWVEKQLYFVSEEYQRPFGLLSVTYQYRVAGRIRS